MKPFQSSYSNAPQPHKAWLIGLMLLTGCAKEVRTPDMFELLSPTTTGIEFINEVQESADLNIVTFEMIYNGAGVAAGDINNDGLPDLFFVSNMGKSRLYLNLGDYKFEDITESSGIDTEGKWANGVTMTDINGDGLLDIYISYGGPYADPARRANELYINNG